MKRSRFTHEQIMRTPRLGGRWDPIREPPRFKALLVKYANPEKPAG
jgi:hypothetical protein